jgi:pheromone shutdown protein TraB
MGSADDAPARTGEAPPAAPKNTASSEAAPDDPSPAIRPARLVLIGTGHVFKIEDAIRGAVQALQPEIVFVELDQGRLNALLHKRRTGVMPQGKKGFVQGRLAAFQESVAGSYGAEVGGEMVAAVEGARDVGARVGLIDVPAQVTVKKALKQLTWSEKGRAVRQVIAAGFRRFIPQRGPEKTLEDEIGAYQDDPAAALDELKAQYPTIYRIVIDERDEHMANRIRFALATGGFGVAVVGDGHVNGMLARLQQVPNLEIETYRLAAVRGGLLPKTEVPVALGSPSSVSYGFNVDL